MTEAQECLGLGDETERDAGQKRRQRDDVVPPASPDEQRDGRRENAEDQRLGIAKDAQSSLSGSVARCPVTGFG